MLMMRELRGSKKEIARQIEQETQPVVSVLLFVEDPESAPTMVRPNEDDIARIQAAFDALAVEAGPVDYPREAMYTRLPGE